MKIAGSFLTIQEEKNKIDKLNEVVDQIHFDIMDGSFTERPTLPLEKIKENLKDIDKPIDIHLMVIDIKRYVNEILKFKPTYITFHIEATDNPKYFINYIKNKNIKVGIAINPETNIDEIYPYLDDIDLVLIMSVHPGKGGQTFIDITDRIEKLYEFRRRNDLSYVIEVDGGINDQTINKIQKADIAVSGSYITSSDNYQEKVHALKNYMKGFTLAELLGVIVLLGIISIIAIGTVDRNIKEGRKKTCKTQETNIIEGAKMWLIDNPNTPSIELTISELQNGGYIDDNLLSPMTEEEYDENSIVVITKGTNKYNVTFNPVGKDRCN